MAKALEVAGIHHDQVLVSGGDGLNLPVQWIIRILISQILEFLGTTWKD
jgi:hypothetical protein